MPTTRTTHVPDDARFVPLVRGVLDALEATGALAPDERVALPEVELPSPFVLRLEARSGLRLWLTRHRQDPDPYAGGAVDVRELRIELGAGRARVALEQHAWVGCELQLSIRGLAPHAAALERAVDAWLASLDAPR